MTEYALAKTGEDIPQVQVIGICQAIFPSFQNSRLGFKFAIKINIKTGERFAFVTEEEKTCLLIKQYQKTQKNQLHALEKS